MEGKWENPSLMVVPKGKNEKVGEEVMFEEEMAKNLLKRMWGSSVKKGKSQGRK